MGTPQPFVHDSARVAHGEEAEGLRTSRKNAWRQPTSGLTPYSEARASEGDRAGPRADTSTGRGGGGEATRPSLVMPATRKSEQRLAETGTRVQSE